MRFRAGFIAISVLAHIFIAPTPNSAQALTGGFASAPRNITQTAVSGGVTLSWNTPADSGNGITGYLIQKSTTGQSGSWVDVVTTTSNPYTVLGLANSAIYLRIAGITSAGTGAFGYPWTKLYKTVTKSRSGTAIVYEYNGSATVGSSFSRVRYLFEDTITAVYNYADVDFYKWAQGGTVTADISTSATVQPSITYLQVPSPAVPFKVQANVSDLTVYSSIGSTGAYANPITNGFGINGRLELWDVNYAKTRNGLSPQGSDNFYDIDDLPSANGSYGSFQVHNTDLGKTIFAWNEHSGANPDIGFGDATGIAAEPDWTFCAGAGTCPAVTSFALTIYVNSPITPDPDTVAPTVTRVGSRFYVKNADTITVRSNEVGTVYLVSQAVTVSNLASITAASTNTKISASISSANTDTTMTIGYQSNGLYNLYAADSLGNLSTTVLATIRIDNTAPAASSITVNSSGTAILLTASETITNSSQILSYYTVSDSGSALSVTATSFSGSVATLTLSRAIPAGATVYFQYNMGAGAVSGRWVDQAGNEMSTIYTQAITNNSAVPISVSLTLPDSISKGIPVTATAVVNVAGKVSFAIAGKRIAGCINKVASGTTPITVTCVFKPAITARQKITATLVPTLSAYQAATSTVERFILKRTTLR